MKELAFPDRHHVLAAEGWLDLGRPEWAMDELRGASAAARGLPVVRNLEWRVLADLRDWPAALAVARAFVEEHPSEVAGWLHRSFALHEMQRTREAMDALAPAAGRFPEEPVVRYNLACYACRLGDLDAARRWLGDVVRLKGVAYLKSMALEDADLALLHEEIRKWRK